MRGQGHDTVYTIGHSNHPVTHFLDLLKQHGIAVLADVRSQPYSQYTSQFNRQELSQAVRLAGIQYLFMGDQLGGRPEGAGFYDADGHVLYAKVAESESFRKGMTALVGELRNHRVALLCSEESPLVCHRHLLIGRVLAEEGFQVMHIRGDGRAQSVTELEEERGTEARQQMLPGMEVTPEWKSIPLVSPTQAPKASSAG